MKKKVIRILLIILAILILTLPINMWLQWHFAEQKKMSVFILDKTVINEKVQEHIGLNWVLKQNKYVKQNNKSYIPNEDYYGFFPDGEGSYSIKDIEQKTEEELNMLANKYDMAYYTDLYGIYSLEWHNEYPQLESKHLPKRVGAHSKMIYGGLTEKELEFLKLMKKRKKLIINEFNIIASPTSSVIRNEYEKEFHINWTGWVGRHFENLDTTINKELPIWLIRNYKKQNNNEWPFKKSGIAFVSNNAKVVILENETHLNSKVPIINTPKKIAEYYGVAENMEFSLWFDICSTDSFNQVISNYNIKTNSKGDSILHKWDIPKEFPAVMKGRKDYPFYYFAGDFADNPVSMKTAKYKHIDKFSYLLYKSNSNQQGGFFWNYYIPLISAILDDYHGHLN